MEEIKLNDGFNESPKKNSRKNIWICITVFLFLIIIAIAVVVGVSAGIDSTDSNYLTYDKYTQIQNGMSYIQVVELFDGNQGVLDTSSSVGGYTLSYYTWSNDSGTKFIVVGFENDRVCAKSQFGLV